MMISMEWIAVDDGCPKEHQSEIPSRYRYRLRLYLTLDKAAQRPQ
jgi:hypothetical protein